MKKKLMKIKDKIIYFFKHTPKKRLLIYFGIFLLCIPVFYGFVTFSRYVIKNTYDNYLLSNEFYFYSDVLDDTGLASYELHDWDSEDSYIITIDVKNYIDELRWTRDSIDYTVSVSCDDHKANGNVVCSANNGTINGAANSTGGASNQVNITLSNPDALEFEDGEYVDMDVSVTSTSPYRKTITGSFKINVTLQEVKYIITDEVNQKYFDFFLSNYGDTAKTLRLGWDSNVVSVDNTNTYVKSGAFRTTTVNSKTYVNGVDITIGARKSMAIRFYKTLPANNYTYPIVTQSSLITVSEISNH